MKEIDHITIRPSTAQNKKYTATIHYKNTRVTKSIHFGDSMYEDYTIHKDPRRRDKYR